MSQYQHRSDEELAHAWIRRFSQNRTSILLADRADSQVRDELRIDAETKWAFDALEELVDNDATHAWALILRILEIAHQDANAMSNLSAGPLETLLARHGQDVLGRVESQAKSDPKFRDLLKGVWRNAIDDAVWEKVQSLSRDSTAEDS